MNIWAFVKHNPLLVLLALALLIFAGMHLVWYIRPSAIKTTAELNERLYDGQPTVVEWYSNL
jgi:hypothetical protein